MAETLPERTSGALNRLVPVSGTSTPDGLRWTVSARCGGCGEGLDLVTDGFTEFANEDGILGVVGAPGPRARMLAAGWVRSSPIEPGGCFSGVMCSGCLKDVEEDEARRRTQAERSGRLSDACLPKALHGFQFEQMNATGYEHNDRMTAISAARNWAAKERVADNPGLLVFGTKGAGKTRLAATTAWQRLVRYPVRWVSWPSLLGQLLGAFNDDDRKVAMSVLNGTQALILDDIARDDITVSDWAKTQLFVAIDKRVQAGAPILLTTNLTGTASQPGNPIAALGERLGESVASRLAGYCRIVPLPGEDQRLRFNFDGTEKKKLTKAEEEAAREGLQDPEVQE